MEFNSIYKSFYYNLLEFQKKSTKANIKILKVKKSLSLMIEEELKDARPLKVTYISNKKAKIVRTRNISDDSTTDEDSS